MEHHIQHTVMVSAVVNVPTLFACPYPAKLG